MVPVSAYYEAEPSDRPLALSSVCNLWHRLHLALIGNRPPIIPNSLIVDDVCQKARELWQSLVVEYASRQGEQSNETYRLGYPP
jgi:hypothetical protein